MGVSLWDFSFCITEPIIHYLPAGLLLHGPHPSLSPTFQVWFPHCMSIQTDTHES